MFIESPIDKFENFEHPDFGEPIEFPTSLVDGQTQWISPHIKNCDVTPKQKRSGMAKCTQQDKNKLVLKHQNYIDVSLDEYEDAGSSFSQRRITRSLAKRLSNTPSQLSRSKKNKNDESPIFPGCISTPDTNQSKTLPASHYLFQGQTPVTKSFIVLAKNTPMG